MTRNDIIRMAREANRYASNQTGDSYEWQEIRDERFAALVAAQEREECAKLCDAMAARCNDIRCAALEVSAENIRSRSQQ